MKFGASQRARFKSKLGAYSVVTERENYDSQITATDSEAELLVNFFGKDNIQVGNVKSNPEKASTTFKLYPSGNDIELNLVYPKPSKTELRLYLSVRSGFKPEPGDVWFMFESEGNLWIGSMSEVEWRSISKILIYDEDEGSYQDALQELDEIKINNLKSRDVYKRDRKKALKRMEVAGHQCEYDRTHNLFISYSTKKPFLEAHHLLPMSLQGETETPLDTLDNIFCLCPHCHRAIHHAEKDLSKSIIDELVNNIPVVLDILNNNIEDIYNYYAVEVIE